MMPDPPTTEGAPFAKGGADNPARDDHHHHGPSRAGHLCVCGQPIETSLWDMTVYATEHSVAYLPCLWAGSNPEPLLPPDPGETTATGPVP